jgi:hypothetical protein
MWMAAWWEYISSWQQGIVSGLPTDLPIKAELPHWHEERERTFLTLILLNDVNNTMATSKLTDVATMVMEECQSPRIRE